MEMKANCESCNKELRLDGLAFICSFECTFCDDCTKQFNNTCPNCSGELVIRPKRIKK